MKTANAIFENHHVIALFSFHTETILYQKSLFRAIGGIYVFGKKPKFHIMGSCPKIVALIESPDCTHITAVAGLEAGDPVPIVENEVVYGTIVRSVLGRRPSMSFIICREMSALMAVVISAESFSTSATIAARFESLAITLSVFAFGSGERPNMNLTAPFCPAGQKIFVWCVFLGASACLSAGGRAFRTSPSNAAHPSLWSGLLRRCFNPLRSLLLCQIRFVRFDCARILVETYSVCTITQHESVCYRGGGVASCKQTVVCF